MPLIAEGRFKPAAIDKPRVILNVARAERDASRGLQRRLWLPGKEEPGQSASDDRQEPPLADRRGHRHHREAQHVLLLRQVSSGVILQV